jgi:hypothetical protein
MVLEARMAQVRLQSTESLSNGLETLCESPIALEAFQVARGCGCEGEGK